MRQHPKPRRRVGAAAVIPEHRPEAADRGRYLNPESFGRRRTEAIGHRTPPKPR